MGQRSPYNDRYKVEQKGKTRKSASAAKPKRAVADLTSGESDKKTAKKPSRWSRAMSASKSPTSASALSKRIEQTQRMKELRRVWWVMWGAALVIALGIVLLQQAAQSASAAAVAAVVAKTALGAPSIAASGSVSATTAAAAAVTARYFPYEIVGWVAWIGAMGGAFYMEFVPIRKERARLVDEAHGGKHAAGAKGTE
jgi:hypothetical protein